MAPPQFGRDAPGYVGWCPTHGKRLFSSRKAGRRAIGKAKGMRAYRCDAVNGLWHVGHNPPVVRRGEMTADEAYRRRETP